MFIKYSFAKLKSNLGQVDPSPAPKTDPEPAAKQDQSQSQQAEKLEGLLADIDLSDVPEEQRADFKKKLAEKVKLYDAGFRSKTEDLSKEKRQIEEEKQKIRELSQLRDEIDGNPELKDQITKMINNARAGIPVTKKETSQASRQLDKLIEQAADAETRESLTQMRNIIREETSDLRGRDDELDRLRKEIESLRNATHMGQAERVTTKIASLKDRFGKEIVEKYEQDIRTAALKYPTQDVDKLFRYVASDDDLSSAYLKEAEKRKKREQELKEEGSSISTSGVRKPIQVEKDKFGRTNIRGLVEKMISSKR